MHEPRIQRELRRLWWLDPAWPFAAIVGITIVAAYCQSEAAYALYRTPKYVQAWHVALAAAAIAAFVLGCRLAAATGRIPEPATDSHDVTIRRWFYVTVVLTLFGYAAWLAVGLKNGFTVGMLLQLMTPGSVNADWIRTNLFPTIPGITTCTQFGVPAVVLGLWLYFRGAKNVIAPLALLVVVATARAIVFNERTALIEMFVPGALVVLRMRFLDRPLPAWFRKTLLAAPVIAPLLLLIFFGSFEYVRSWRFYHTKFDSFAEFTVWRLSGYYTTAHNNGAMAMETGQPRPLPYYTLRPLWLFPGVRDSPLGYQHLTDLDVEENHTLMLERFGNVELNNEGGFFQPALDYGVAGSLLFWAAYGFVAGRFYRGFQAGTIAGVSIYPLIYLSILEVPLVLFLCYPRMFPAFVTLAIVAWTTRRKESLLPAPRHVPAMLEPS